MWISMDFVWKFRWQDSLLHFPYTAPLDDLRSGEIMGYGHVYRGPNRWVDRWSMIGFMLAPSCLIFRMGTSRVCILRVPPWAFFRKSGLFQRERSRGSLQEKRVWGRNPSSQRSSFFRLDLRYVYWFVILMVSSAKSHQIESGPLLAGVSCSFLMVGKFSPYLAYRVLHVSHCFFICIYDPSGTLRRRGGGAINMLDVSFLSLSK